MERLIKNGDVILDGTLTRYQKEKQAFEKLKKLEDIEEELGLDLAIVFKALSFPIYVKEKDQTWWCSNRLFFGIGEAFIVITYWNGVENEDIICLLKDYGKTWALTKEELEHGQSSNQE